ncbi:hypothetical protein [Sphingomonas asaccharolytica]|uniref:hypothetical protein n=1 Tax=Sphingomonas asaccharolytica TaxID=40681 RepID=UPI0012ECDB1A|nr:hypothetical protein [Sphingomonas asaccharolytica]
MKTWNGMEDLLDANGAEAADVVFYGYSSLAAPAQNSATLFLKFLNAAAGAEASWMNTLFRAGAPGDRAYRDILVVAHSLGALVTRRALLDAISSDFGWVKRSRLLLFGPAHMGTRLPELKAMLNSGAGSILADAFTFAQIKMPVIDDLAKDSDFLKDLLADSQAAVDNGVDQPVRAEGVIFGQFDNIVINRTFCRDPLADVWDNEDHCSVCRAPQTVFAVARHL